MVYKWQEIYQWLWPTQCVICRGPGCYPLDICAACRVRLPRNTRACRICALPLPQFAGAAPVCGRCAFRRPAFRQVFAPFLFKPPVDTLITDLKFGGRLHAGRLLGDLLAAEAVHAARPQALIPVPLHPARLRSRGFNQAREIALRLACKTQVPVLSGALTRQRETLAQSRLDRQQRQKNLRAAFRCTAVERLDHVALVDDVVTTGATADAAARELCRCGIKTVDVWAVARTPTAVN